MSDVTEPSPSIDILSGYANFVLVGTSGFAISRISWEHNPLAFISVSTLMAHGLIGMLSSLHTSLEGHKLVQKAHNLSSLVAESASLPLVNGQLALKNEEEGQRLVLCFLASALAAPANQFSQILREPLPGTTRVADLMTLGNIAALGYVAVTKEDYVSLGLASWTLFANVFLPLVNSEAFEDFDLRTFCLSGTSLLIAGIFGESLLSQGLEVLAETA